MSKLQGQGPPTRSTEREAHLSYCVKQRLKWAAERLNGEIYRRTKALERAPAAGTIPF